MSKIEKDLYEYLSPRARQEVDDYLALEDEAIRLMAENESVPEVDEDRLRDEERERP